MHGMLKGARALVHCAYDFAPRRCEDIAAINVTGSQKLLKAARKAGIESVVFISIAHEQGWDREEILGQIAEVLGRRVSFVPVPWQCVWLALKSLELAGVQTIFRSDSLISMVYQNPRPAFTSPKSLGFECRPFKLAPGTFLLRGP